MSELFDAIRAGDTERVRALVKTDPSLASSLENNISAVLMAVYCGKSDIAQLLAASGASIDIGEAAALGDFDRVKRFVEADPKSVNARSADGFTALTLAIFFRHPEVARYLIEHGADVNAAATNAQRVAPLHSATSVRDAKTIHLLLERGADPNAKQQNDGTPLHNAAGNGDIEIAKMLLAHGADRTARMSDGASVAEVAAKRNQTAFAEWLAAIGK